MSIPDIESWVLANKSKDAQECIVLHFVIE